MDWPITRVDKTQRNASIVMIVMKIEMKNHSGEQFNKI